MLLFTWKYILSLPSCHWQWTEAIKFWPISPDVYENFSNVSLNCSDVYGGGRLGMYRFSRSEAFLTLKGKQLKGIMWIWRERRRASGWLTPQDGRVQDKHIYPLVSHLRSNSGQIKISSRPNQTGGILYSLAALIFMLDCSRQTQQKPTHVQSPEAFNK